MGYSCSCFKKCASWGLCLITGCGVAVTGYADKNDSASGMQQNYSPEITTISSRSGNNLHRILLSNEHQTAAAAMRRRTLSAEELKSLHKGLRENISQAYGQPAVHTAK